MKHIHVTCGIIECDGVVLAAQRSATMNLPLKWEFPGGKIREGESPEDCLRRELLEEMAIRVAIRKGLHPSTHGYPSFTVTLYPFVCKIDAGDVILREHARVVWLDPRDLPSLDWAEADVRVVQTYLSTREA